MNGGLTLAKASNLLHEHLLLLLVLAYVLALLWPAPGLIARRPSLGEVTVFHESTRLTPPVLLLATLLFTAGLGVPVHRLWGMARNKATLLVGLSANVVLPVAYIFGVMVLMRSWPRPDETQSILTGLALVVSMPIAGSSTAWAQTAEGDLALSLGLVFGSTLLSPLTTPLVLHAVGLMAQGGYASDLHRVATFGTDGFLIVGIVLPSLLGIACRGLIGDRRLLAAKPVLKLINGLVLLFLNYSNAAVSLPRAIGRTEMAFFVALLGIVIGLCVTTFTAGWSIARMLSTGRAQRASLMYGLGLNNNGTGLVLASVALANHPRAMLAIILYNLVQHLVAGAVYHVTRADRSERDEEFEGALTHR